MSDIPKKKKRFKISGTLIFNIAVAVISIWLILNFVCPENGLIDLLKRQVGLGDRGTPGF